MLHGRQLFPADLGEFLRYKKAAGSGNSWQWPGRNQRIPRRFLVHVYFKITFPFHKEAFLQENARFPAGGSSDHPEPSQPSLFHLPFHCIIVFPGCQRLPGISLDWPYVFEKKRKNFGKKSSSPSSLHTHGARSILPGIRWIESLYAWGISAPSKSLPIAKTSSPPKERKCSAWLKIASMPHCPEGVRNSR